MVNKWLAFQGTDTITNKITKINKNTNKCGDTNKYLNEGWNNVNSLIINEAQGSKVLVNKEE